MLISGGCFCEYLYKHQVEMTVGVTRCLKFFINKLFLGGQDLAFPSEPMSTLQQNQLKELTVLQDNQTAGVTLLL